MDERVRALLGAWQESGSKEDEAAYLRARIQAGTLAKDRLRAAIWLGDEVAREVGAELLGHEATVLQAPKTGVVAFLQGLPGDRALRKRALWAAIEWTGAQLTLDIEVAAVFESFAAYWKDPQPSAVPLIHAQLGAIFRGPADREQAAFARALAHALNAVVREGEGRFDGLLHMAAYKLGEPLTKPRQLELREAIRAALHPWLFLDPGSVPDVPPEPPAEEAPQVFVPELMTPPVRRRLARLVPAKPRPTTDEARAILRAYLKAIGWREQRTSFHHPENDLRVRFRPQVLIVETGGTGAWARHPAYAGRKLSLVDVASQVLDQAAQAVQAEQAEG